MRRQPVLFISHGSPMFALEPGRLGPQLHGFGAALSGVRAILVVSPHWQTRGVRVTASPAPETLHDFGGFPAPLYRLRYPAAGAPAVAQAAAALLAEAGFTVDIDGARGLDHGAWVPLRHLRPQADLPVLQVSLPQDIDAAGALRLGRALAPLRERGVLLIGSGSLTHNLYELRQSIRDPEYAQVFADWVREAVARGDTAALLDYRRQAPQATRAHPSEEHFLPLLVALGASDAGDAPQWIAGGMTYGVLSMDSFAWLPADADADREAA
ncbi:dioxygenase family protein [Tahibacter caeni]|uniref:dioxygenase family protein n=1 Tax=Tahibacter caeni TaxID=1453545 RepID=UPI002147AFC4|nr:class III extradiol ring-cleavage dioxygenase [Tahibacter caeni]